MRLPRLILSISLITLALGAFAPVPTYAESFLLKNGGQIDGELLNPKRSAAEPYQVKTSAGARVSLGRETVAKVVVVREAETEYERLLPKVPNTAEGHWEMAEWCRENGLRAQREQQLQQVVSLEPDHERAHLALGHSKLGGKWQKMDDYMQAQGYVKHEGHWRTRQEVEIELKRAETEGEVLKWRKQIKNIWLGWIGKKREAEALANLRQVRDPYAAPTLIEVLGEKGTSRDLKLLIIDVLSEMNGNPAENTFIKLYMTEQQDQGISDACLDYLVRIKSKWAVHQFVAAVKNEKSLPATINRAAVALGRLKDPIATTALIDALETKHTVIIQPGGGDAGGLGNITAGSGGLNAGAPKPIKKTITSPNQQVLAALTTLHPGVNFSFNEDAWRDWYTETHEPADVNLRRAD